MSRRKKDQEEEHLVCPKCGNIYIVPRGIPFQVLTDEHEPSLYGEPTPRKWSDRTYQYYQCFRNPEDKKDPSGKWPYYCGYVALKEEFMPQRGLG